MLHNWNSGAWPIVRGAIWRHLDGCVSDWWFLVYAPINLSDLACIAGVGWQVNRLEACCLDDLLDECQSKFFGASGDIRAMFWHSLLALRPYYRGGVRREIAWRFDYEHVDPWIFPWGYHVFNRIGQHVLDPGRWIGEG